MGVVAGSTKGLRKFVYELSDTGPFAQSGTVVDQEPHGEKSTMLALNLLGVE